MISSRVHPGGEVLFPAFTGERVYMQEMRDGVVPEALERWRPTIEAMLGGTPPPVAYVMIDQKRLRRGEIHRRPGLHVDGNWTGNVYSEHRMVRHNPDTIVLASNVMGCRALVGEFDGPIGLGGQAEALDLAEAESLLMEAGRAYVLDANTVHESLPVAVDCERTVVRINIPA